MDIYHKVKIANNLFSLSDKKSYSLAIISTDDDTN